MYANVACMLRQRYSNYTNCIEYDLVSPFWFVGCKILDSRNHQRSSKPAQALAKVTWDHTCETKSWWIGLRPQPKQWGLKRVWHEFGLTPSLPYTLQWSAVRTSAHNLSLQHPHRPRLSAQTTINQTTATVYQRSIQWYRKVWYQDLPSHALQLAGLELRTFVAVQGKVAQPGKWTMDLNETCRLKFTKRERERRKKGGEAILWERFRQKYDCNDSLLHTVGFLGHKPEAQRNLPHLKMLEVWQLSVNQCPEDEVTKAQMFTSFSVHFLSKVSTGGWPFKAHRVVACITSWAKTPKRPYSGPTNAKISLLILHDITWYYCISDGIHSMGCIASALVVPKIQERQKDPRATDISFLSMYPPACDQQRIAPSLNLIDWIQPPVGKAV